MVQSIIVKLSQSASAEDKQALIKQIGDKGATVTKDHSDSSIFPFLAVDIEDSFDGLQSLKDHPVVDNVEADGKVTTQ